MNYEFVDFEDVSIIMFSYLSCFSFLGLFTLSSSSFISDKYKRHMWHGPCQLYQIVVQNPRVVVHVICNRTVAIGSWPSSVRVVAVPIIIVKFVFNSQFFKFSFQFGLIKRSFWRARSKTATFHLNPEKIITIHRSTSAHALTTPPMTHVNSLISGMSH